MLAFIGLGSNMAGDAQNVTDQLVYAAGEIERTGAGRIVERSRIFATPPWGVLEQDDFRNAVIAVDTELAPLDFLHACQAIEHSAHRTREVRWGPRTLDLDVLALFSLLSDATYHPITSDGQWGKELTVPHPYAHQRGFVLVPWADLSLARAEGVLINGNSVDHWLGELAKSAPEEVAGVQPVSVEEAAQWEGLGQCPPLG